MPIMTFKRFEEKFLITEQQYKNIMPEIEKYMTSDKYCLNGNEYSIYNVYFDTPNDELIRHSINKVNYKEKIRMRSYYPQKSLDDKVFLELKRKYDGVVYKRRVSLNIAEVNRMIENKCLDNSENNYLKKQVINEINHFLKVHNIVPKVAIRYDRNALFCSYDKNIRITFDRNIYARRQNIYLGESEFDSRILQEGYRLMEIKNNGSLPTWIIQILSKNKIYNTSFSKYGTEYKMFIKNKISENRKVV